ncbi:alpha/beta fold hydrolase [Nitratireductor thuwali]|uniref:2-hydroxy-6-oxo-6-phenylhexa-2,4-dienoate hydrolase n=1 Tax=Nitratireductor thuwali TaxID=2267699 RepID=A0ABY5MMB3_9HYPH|nr:2-hydroxy-6-oxo-6-phenylhexa-2,4-dienoate hydrolase [Nitratireductor thuwali]
MRTGTATIVAAGLMISVHLASAQEGVYGPRLEGFDYPYAIQTYSFTSQGAEHEMAYMDVAPKGTGNGRTVALLHGKNFCSATWEETISTLSDAGYRVIAPDQVGFCASTKPDGYQFSLAQLAANTKSLLDSLGIERVTLGGHSMGGMLAMRFAIQYPDSVEQLVLVNPIGLEDWQAEGVPYATIDGLYQAELTTNADSIKAYQQRFFYSGEWKEAYDRPVSMLAGLYAGPGGEKVAYIQAQTSEMLLGQPVLYEFPRISAPTLLLIGGLDRTALGANRSAPDVAARLGNYPVLARQAAERIPNATLVEFPDLGHSPQMEEPEKFHDALLKGIARLN